MTTAEDVWPIIVARRARDFLSEHSPAFLSFLRKWEADPASLRLFPDGSLHVDGDRATTELHVLVAPFRGRFLDVNAVHRSLAPFPGRFYALYSTGVPGAPVGDVLFVVVPVAATPKSPGENRLEDLSVAIGFRRRVSKQGMRRFATALAEWASSVAECGIFGEGPARLACSDVEFQGLRARFRVDASRSGQNTLNWLTLSILGVSDRSLPVRRVVYDDEEKLDNYVGPARGDPVRVAIPRTGYVDAGKAEGTRDDEEVRPYVQQGAGPDPVLRSDRFPVLCLPNNDWDDFVLAVYFSTQPETDQRREFRELIRSWFIVGQYGGLGEPGLSSFQNVQFDDATESASVRADMIGSDPELALPVLIRALEGYDTCTAPIEAVVFGRPDRLPDVGAPPRSP